MPHAVKLQTPSCPTNTQRNEVSEGFSCFRGLSRWNGTNSTVVVMSFPLSTSTYHQKVPGSPAFSLWLSAGRNCAVLLFPCLQRSCLALNSHGSGAEVSWQGTSHLPPAEVGMKVNSCMGRSTHQAVQLVAWWPWRAIPMLRTVSVAQELGCASVWTGGQGWE